MIKIQKEDTIVDILKKMNLEKSNDIKLDFPFWHPVLHNQLSLKIIKTKAKKKNLFIISNDKTAKKISKLIWIKFISNKKIKKTENITTKDILKQNYTFIEYAKFEIKNYFRKIKNIINWNIKNNKKINTIFYLKNKYWETHKTIIPYFILILTLIILLLLYIYYIAINKTVVKIYPETILKTKSKNFTFIENTKDIEKKYNYINNKILINRINKKISLTKTIWTSWIKQKEENLSKWKIILYNYLEEESFLLKNTTLENKDWVQFYIPEAVSIPAWKIKNWKFIPWEKIVTLFGKIKLLNWDYSWEKTNIKKWKLLTIPKLWEYKTKIFAKSITNFSWWSNKFTKFLTEKDLENAKILLENTLKEEAIKKIKDDIKESNKQNSIKVELLPVDNIFKFTNLSIKIPEHLKIWDEIKKFNISWEIEITSFTYNKQAVVSLLKNSINKNIIKDSQKIISIDDEQVRISYIINRNDLKKVNWVYRYIQNINTPFIIKATTQIEYLISKKFNNQNNIFIKQMKYSILWKNIDEAEKILINKPEINNVEIEIKPFFMKNISKIPQNIEVIIEN